MTKKEKAFKKCIEIATIFNIDPKAIYFIRRRALIPQYRNQEFFVAHQEEKIAKIKNEIGFLKNKILKRENYFSNDERRMEINNRKLKNIKIVLNSVTQSINRRTFVTQFVQSLSDVEWRKVIN